MIVRIRGEKRDAIHARLKVGSMVAERTTFAVLILEVKVKEGKRKGVGMILVVVFDERSSLGLVRLRAKKAGAELAKVFEEVRKKAESEMHSASPFTEVTDDDIDSLFND